MPVTREMADQTAIQKGAVMELKKLLYESPLGRHVDPWFVEVPEGHDYVPVWVDPKKVQKKKVLFHAETVAPKYAIDTYKIPKDQVVGTDHVERMGLVLMHYPRRAYEVRQAFPVVRHWDQIDKEVRDFNNSPDAVVLDPEALAGSGRVTYQNGAYRPAMTQKNARPRRPLIEDALAAHGLVRSQIDPDLLSEKDEE